MALEALREADAPKISRFTPEEANHYEDSFQTFRDLKNSFGSGDAHPGRPGGSARSERRPGPGPGPSPVRGAGPHLPEPGCW